MAANIVIPEEIREEAKRLYFKYWTPREISNFMEQNYQTVKKWITRYGWYKEREQIETEALQELANRRSHQMNSVMTDGLEVISNAISQAKRGGATMEDAERISKMIGNIDKVYRLQSGKPTEIKEERKVTSTIKLSTKDELLQAIKDDPFIEANFKDVTPEPESN